MAKTIVALDIETTGLEADRDAIIEIGAVRFKGERVEAEFSTLVNPGRKLSPFITRLTGITDAMLVNAPRLPAVSKRAKKSGTIGKAITLKLKTKDFESRTRSMSLSEGTNLTHVIFEAGVQMLRKEVGPTKFRLIGIGIHRLQENIEANMPALDSKQVTLTKAELAMDKIRNRFGSTAIDRGISLKDK